MSVAPPAMSALQWCYQGLCVRGQRQGQGRETQEQGRGQGLETNAKAKKKLPAKTKDIQMPLLQWDITVNWGDFKRILNILNVISSIILLESANNAKNIRQTKKTDILWLLQFQTK